MRDGLDRIIVTAVIAILMLVTAGALGQTPAPGVLAATPGGVALSVPLPAELKARGKLSVGVKCDFPPFGFVDANGGNVGYEIDMIHAMAQYAFGDRNAVALQCVTSSNRIPYLTTTKVDLVVATMNYTPERAKVIAFSAPYWSSGMSLLVPQDSTISSVKQLAGKSVLTQPGSTEELWFKQCMPEVHLVLYPGVGDALTALLQGRGVAFAQDATVLSDIASKNHAIRLVATQDIHGPWGIGVRLGDTATLNWVNATLHQLQQQDFFWREFVKWEPQANIRAAFPNAVPRPGVDLTYPATDAAFYACRF